MSDIACRHVAGRGDVAMSGDGFTVVFVRRGCFVRSADGVESVLDSTMAYCVSAGVHERFDHPHHDGDDCTAVRLDPTLVADLWSRPDHLPTEPLSTPPAIDLMHRTALAAARRADDPDGVVELAVCAVAATLAGVEGAYREDDRRPLGAARRKLADDAREALSEDPGRSLIALAGTLAVSPHHLSRVFSAHTGRSISRHRTRLRVRDALERLAGGETHFARVAADVGFSDHGHLATENLVGARTCTAGS
jgi:AraC-like DNA-binding protein